METKAVNDAATANVNSSWHATGMQLAEYMLKADGVERPTRDYALKKVEEYRNSCKDPRHPRAAFKGPSLRELLSTCEITQKRLGDATTYSKSVVSGWVNDESSISADAFEAICVAIAEKSRDGASALYALLCLCGIAEETPEVMSRRIDAMKRTSIKVASDVLSGYALDSLYLVAESLRQACANYREDHDGDNRAHEAMDLLGLENMFESMRTDCDSGNNNINDNSYRTFALNNGICSS